MGFNTPLEYIHRIGRTGRGVNGKGHALVFFEYTPKNTAAAEGLIDVLERSKQKVPPELRVIAAEVKSGLREDFYKEKEKRMQWQSSSWDDWSKGQEQEQEQQQWQTNGWNGRSKKW